MSKTSAKHLLELSRSGVTDSKSQSILGVGSGHAAEAGAEGHTHVAAQVTGEAPGHSTMPQDVMARAAVLQAQAVQREAGVSLTVVPVAVATKPRAATVAATVRLLSAWVSYNFHGAVFLVKLHCNG